MSQPMPRPAEKPLIDDRLESIPSLGERIRELRRSKQISLQVLADMSGVSVSMLSQIERNRANPSLRLLTRIRKALGMQVTELFAEVPPEPRDPDFARRAPRRPKLDLGLFTKELLSCPTARNLSFQLLHLPPGGSSGEHAISDPSEKGGMVLQGELVLTVGGTECVLNEGDSFSFDGDRPHRFRNDSDEEVTLLWIIATMSIDRHL
jgi:transcriptional regulator with XRE-family HTH domain